MCSMYLYMRVLCGVCTDILVFYVEYVPIYYRAGLMTVWLGCPADHRTTPASYTCMTPRKMSGNLQSTWKIRKLMEIHNISGKPVSY